MASRWHEFATHTIIKCDDYLADMDEYRDDADKQLLVIHITFHKFTPSVFKRMLREWQAFRKCTDAPLYAWQGPGEFKKWHSFVTRLGFVPTGRSITCNNGAVRQIYISGSTDVFQTDYPEF